MIAIEIKLKKPQRLEICTAMKVVCRRGNLQNKTLFRGPFKLISKFTDAVRKISLFQVLSNYDLKQAD